MRLKLIIETLQQQTEQLAISKNTTTEVIVQMCKQVSNKYWKWVLRQWYNNNFILPEDAFRVNESLKRFLVISPRLPPAQRDINQYKKLSDVEQLTNSFMGVEMSSKVVDVEKLVGDGAKVIQRVGNYITLEVNDAGALKELGEGTKWCTRGSYKDCMAEDYIDRYDKIYIVLHYNRPVLQYTPDYSQVMDINDDPVTDRKLLDLIPAPNPSTNAAKSLYYAMNIIRGRWPEAEPTIMQEPIIAHYYAKWILQSRWSEAEPYILTDPKVALEYARDVIKGRWSAAEPYIMRDSDLAMSYARYIVKGRWPEAEPYIMRDSDLAMSYAKYIVKGRWPEAEPYIMKSPFNAYNYAKNIIKGRWVEAEPYIMKDAYTAELYTNKILMGS